MKKPVIMLFAAALILTILTAACLADETSETLQTPYTDVAVLSTTDMHGKCWNTNVLTDTKETSNMLHVSSAAEQFREEYGAENVILIDNGDLFQGTQVSQVQLLDYASGISEDTPAMAVCLKEAGYDAFVLGNHEFNYNWNAMSRVYQYLEDNGIPVLAGNVVYDGTDPAHAAGENVFTPYIIKEIPVGGHMHKIGILGLENTDITRWDLPSNYPGLQFVHPENENWQISYEAELYLPRMKEEGCEFIIVSYHSGLGDTEGDVTFGVNSENQGLRLIRQTEDIDMLILGHDHTGGYSNSLETNRAGEQVLVVNGGSQNLTKSVFRFTENADGELCYEITETENLELKDYETDTALEEIIAPYAALAEEDVNRVVGIASGDWDMKSDYYTQQCDTIDLVSAAMMGISSERLKSLYEEDGNISEEVSGQIDHLDVDMAMTSVAVSGSYEVSSGELSMKDIYRLYRFANKIAVLPMTGQKIRAVMEENAANRLKVRVINGEASYYPTGDNFTNIIFAGLNFAYDMSKPEGERVQIDSFANGRRFEEDEVYLVVTNNYILGNEHCGLREFGEEDAIWSLGEEETIQDIITEFLRERNETAGSLTPDIFNWTWETGYSADPAALPPYEGEASAALCNDPEEGHSYVLYHEAEGIVLTDREINGALGGSEVEAYGNLLIGEIPENAFCFTIHSSEAGNWLIKDSQRRYLTCGGDGGGLVLTQEEASDGLSEWSLEKAHNGWYILSTGTENSTAPRQAIGYYDGCFTAYRFAESGAFLFSLYEVD